jgi:hypothetical protein
MLALHDEARGGHSGLPAREQTGMSPSLSFSAAKCVNQANPEAFSPSRAPFSGIFADPRP